ncbi:hypothetical protein [Thioalkalivibrio nitratireducens]|nr:hypothetical protein [Thioalkalivibrio nitratireducens]
MPSAIAATPGARLVSESDRVASDYAGYGERLADFMQSQKLLRACRDT